MSRIKRTTTTLLTAFIGALLAIYFYPKIEKTSPEKTVIKEVQPIRIANMQLPAKQEEYPGLTYAAGKGTPAVVHIKTTMYSSPYSSRNPFFDFFFGDKGYSPEPRYQQGSGSGVIISSDGYIVTNRHVINNATNIEVTLNDGRTFEAKLVGEDESTDIALTKIDKKELPYLDWGSSEELQPGEWVLAVGNPFNLTSTVTAGIVSAKARSIGIMGGQMPLESFIQTDAAVNPGNSGGALLNREGELVGINTAIASRTGSFTGYSFAVPSMIAQKVVEDLKEYGEVQRAILGVQITTVTSELKKEKKLSAVKGVYVVEVMENGAAKKSGIKEGDVIIAVNSHEVNSVPELQEQIGRFRPGDRVSVDIKRKGKVIQYDVILRNTQGNTSIIKKSISVLGAEFGPVSKKDMEKLGISSGVQITKVKKGKFNDIGVQDGFIIVAMNRAPVNSADDIKRAMDWNNASRPILVEGVYPSGEWEYFALRID